MKLRYTPASQWDIRDIYVAIARHDPVAAQRVEDYIRETAERLQRFPLVGISIQHEDVRRLPLVRFP